MALHLKVDKRRGEKTRRLLVEKDILDYDMRVLHEGDFILFPVREGIEIKDTEIVDVKGERKEKSRKNFGPADILRGDLTEKEIESLPSSFDVIGDILILELDDALVKKKELVGGAFLKAYKHVNTVLRKESHREGEFRTRRFELLAGEDRRETIHKEYGMVLKVDVERAYFSPREARERSRVAKQVKENESVLVMFSGIGPFGIRIAKEKESCKVVCVEKNPDAVAYADENVHLNKLEYRMENVCGDAREICGRFRKKDFDRILMPLPKGAFEFLDVAIPLLKDGGVLHFYHWGPESDLFSRAERLVREEAEKQKRGIKILEKKKVLPYAPRTWKVVIDAEMR